MKVAFIGPFAPPIGGMTILSDTLVNALRHIGLSVSVIKTNSDSENRFNTSYIGKLVLAPFFLFKLRKVVGVDTVLLVSSSGMYFYTKASMTLLVCKLTRTPIVLDFVGGKGIDKIERGDRFFIYLLKQFDVVLVPTNIFKTALSSVGIKCELFPHIVNIERFSNKKKKGTHLTLLAAKALEAYSNVEGTIMAFSQVKADYPDAELIIVGEGPHKSFLEQLVHKLDLADVRFVGSVNYDQMPLLFQDASIFVHGTKYESFGLVLVEALASGTPVVSSNVGGISDIIVDGNNGFLVDYNDADAMAQRIVELHEKPDLYDKFVLEGLVSAKQYSLESLAPQLKKEMLKVAKNQDVTG
jgi:glycosyltransferase involved in cell wall biosynthesis